MNVYLLPSSIHALVLVERWMNILNKVTTNRAITKTMRIKKMLEKVKGIGFSVVPRLNSSVAKTPLKEKSACP